MSQCTKSFIAKFGSQNSLHKFTFLASSILLAGLVACAHSPANTSVILGTATPGGGFTLYGGELAKIVNESNSGLLIEPRNTRGSLENIPLLESGELDIALVSGEPAYEALSGVNGPAADLRIILAMYSTPGMFAVRGDSPYQTIADLEGQPIAFGTRSSGLPILAHYVLDGMGLNREEDFEVIFVDRASDGPVMLREGSVEAIWGGGSGWPSFVTVIEEGGRFIFPSDEDIEKILNKHSYLRDLTLAPNSYPGQTEAMRSVGSWSFLLARPTLDEEVAYRLTRALHQNEMAFAELLPQASESTAVNTATAAYQPELLHPGTRRYLQEIGLVD